MIILQSGLRKRQMMAVVCLLGSFVTPLVSALANRAQAARDVRDFPFNYGQAVTCAGVMRAAAPSSRPATSQHLLWTFAMAAGELGRKTGRLPEAVERDMALAERKARRYSPALLRARTKSCRHAAAKDVARRG